MSGMRRWRTLAILALEDQGEGLGYARLFDAVRLTALL